MNLKNYYPNNDGLAGLRNRLGFTQQQLAAELKISRSTVAMVENKKRSMPTDILIKMASLEIQFAGNKMQQETMLPHPAEAGCPTIPVHAPSLFERELRCRIQSRNLAAKLDRMTQEYKSVRAHLDIIPKLIESSAANEDSVNWWKASEQSCLKKMQKCSLQQQALLRNKIALMNAEMQLSKSIQQHFDISPATEEEAAITALTH